MMVNWSDGELDALDRAHERRQDDELERAERLNVDPNDWLFWYDVRDFGWDEAMRRRSNRWQIRRTDE